MTRTVNSWCPFKRNTDQFGFNPKKYGQGKKRTRSHEEPLRNQLFLAWRRDLWGPCCCLPVVELAHGCEAPVSSLIQQIEEMGRQAQPQQVESPPLRMASDTPTESQSFIKGLACIRLYVFSRILTETLSNEFNSSTFCKWGASWEEKNCKGIDYTMWSSLAQHHCPVLNEHAK